MDRKGALVRNRGLFGQRTDVVGAVALQSCGAGIGRGRSRRLSLTIRFGSLLCLLVFLLAQSASGAAILKSAKVENSGESSRLLLDFSAGVTHKFFTLSAPDRLVIDLTETQLGAALDRLDLAATPIARIRTSHQPQSARLVFDLKQRTPVRVYLTATEGAATQQRLVVELGAQKKTAKPPLPAAAATARSVKPPVAEKPRSPSVTQPPLVKGSEKPSPAASQSARVTAVAPNVKSVQQLNHERRDLVIAIDAGHGGDDPGALGPGGIREKEITLAIARQLHGLLSQEPGFKPVLIRSGDRFVPLRQRTEIARKHKADLFISIHADSFSGSDARGGSVYTLSQRGASSESARWLADQENKADLVGGVGLDQRDGMVAQVILDLYMTATLNTSNELASELLRGLNKVGPLHRQQVEKAGFMVLKSPDIPSVLVETGFISNPSEARLLNTRQHQQRLAQSLRGAIVSYYSRRPPEGTMLAWRKRGGDLSASPAVAQNESSELPVRR